jgi:hypothetical protein
MKNDFLHLDKISDEELKSYSMFIMGILEAYEDIANLLKYTKSNVDIEVLTEWTNNVKLTNQELSEIETEMNKRNLKPVDKLSDYTKQFIKENTAPPDDFLDKLRRK